MTIRFLLINDNELTDSYWKKLLGEALAPLGELFVVDQGDSTAQIVSDKYDVAIVDSTSVKEVELLVSRLRSKRKDCRIVVVTASPTWQRARAAFEAGAIDYISKSFDKTDLLNTFRQILQKPLPDWPR